MKIFMTFYSRLTGKNDLVFENRELVMREGDQMSESIIDKMRSYFKENVTRPLSVEEIQDVLGIDHSADFKELIKSLNDLEASGELVRTRKDRFGLPEKMNLVRGSVQMHKKGFAFLIPDDEDQTDVYIHAHLFDLHHPELKKQTTSYASG